MRILCPRLAYFFASLAAVVLTFFPSPVISVERLGDRELRGKRIYTEGLGTKAITAYLPGPGLKVPGKRFPCLQCHPDDGSSNREGGVYITAITYESLTRPYEGMRDSGRAHPPYDERLLARAVEGGVDPAGNVLHVVMPRYFMDTEDMDDLIAYLKVLGDEPVPGVTESTIRVGVLLPDRGPLLPVGEEVKRILHAYFGERNSRGGIYGRTIEIVPLPFDPGESGSASRAAKDLLSKDPVFCFLLNLGPHDSDTSALLTAQKIPVISPLGITPHNSFETERYTFYLYSSIHDQARVLVDALAAEPGVKGARVALIYSGDQYGDDGRSGVKAQITKYSMTMVWESSYRSPLLDGASLASEIKSRSADAVFFWGSGADAARFAKASHDLGFRPLVFGSLQLFGSAVLSLSPSLAGTMILTSPGGDKTDEQADFFGFLGRHGIGAGHLTFQISAFAGAKVLEEGLRMSGRRVSRGSVVANLEKLWQFRTGVTPPLTYNENRKSGAIGSSILRFSAKEGTFIPFSEWREPE